MLVGVLSHIVEFRNGESGAHVRHIRIITELLLHRLLEISSQYPITAEQQDNIPLASALHDIGKIGIDEKILNKPGRLTPEEFEVVKTHSMLGAEMLHQLEDFNEQPLLQTAYEIARWHHERWDGRGYPDGLKGDDIPISAQLVALDRCVRCTDQRTLLQKSLLPRKSRADDPERRVRSVQPFAAAMPDGCADRPESPVAAADAITTGERKSP